MASMIAAVCWVPRGAANPVPVTIEPTEEELEALKLAANQDVDANGSSDGEDEEEEEMEDESGINKSSDAVATALAAAKILGGGSDGQTTSMDVLADGLAELDMDHYDDDDEGPDSGIQLFGNGGLGAAYYASNEDDPYLLNKEDDDEDEIEDMTIKATDLLLLTARTEDDVSHLEVWVYECDEPADEGDSNMYVHHDIMLSAFPLALAWLDCGPSGKENGNFVAVGTMHPEIEIWDLDVIDAVEPIAMLGGAEQQIPGGDEETKGKKSKKKKKKKKELKLKEGSHTDAVLGLAWNMEFRNVIASSSADHSVKIWDVNTQKCEHTVRCHTDKVQAVAWNRKQPTVLISGSFDGTVVMVDGRAPGDKAIWWAVPADVESLAWDPHTEHSFVVSLEDGTIRGHDIRSGGLSARPSPESASKAVYTIHAHEKAVCSVSYSLVAPNLLATGSMDKTVKLWDLTDNHPSCISSVNPKVGAIFSTSFCKDLPFVLAVGGSKGNLHVLNTLQNAEVVQRFGRFAS